MSTWRRAIILFLLAALLAGPMAGQQRAWGIGLDVGLTRFWGGSEPVAPSTSPGFRPYRPTAFTLRLDRRLGRAGIGLGILWAESGLGVEDQSLTVIAKGGLTWVQVAPELAYRLGTLGPVAELRAFGGPVADVWFPDGGDSRAVLGGRAGLELLVPLGSRLAGTVRAHGGLTGSLFADSDVPADFRTQAMPNVGVALGVRVAL